MRGWWSSTTLATSPRRRGAPSGPLGAGFSSVGSTGTLASSAAVLIGDTCRTASRWLGASKNPPVPGLDASRKLREETHSELPAVLTTWFSETLSSFRCCGSTWTWSWRSRWPQMATLATPGTPRRRGLIVQRARTPMSMRESWSDDSPIISTRLVDDVGGSMTGGLDTLGMAAGWFRRSWTIWRALRRFVPGSKIRWIDESPGIDSEWIVCSQATPLRRSASSGTVMSCSISAAESPRASVWMSTDGGVNSG